MICITAVKKKRSIKSNSQLNSSENSLEKESYTKVIQTLWERFIIQRFILKQQQTQWGDCIKIYQARTKEITQEQIVHLPCIGPPRFDSWRTIWSLNIEPLVSLSTARYALPQNKVKKKLNKSGTQNSNLKELTSTNQFYNFS